MILQHLILTAIDVLLLGQALHDVVVLLLGAKAIEVNVAFLANFYYFFFDLFQVQVVPLQPLLVVCHGVNPISVSIDLVVQHILILVQLEFDLVKPFLNFNFVVEKFLQLFFHII